MASESEFVNESEKEPESITVNGSEKETANETLEAPSVFSANETVIDAFEEVYTKFKLHFYREVFRAFDNREATLTTVETFCMEVIYAMGCPTVNEFASFIQISPPNAAYKINNLIKKGYVEKIRSKKDRREYYLKPTQKYLDYYNVSSRYLRMVLERLEARLPGPDQEKLHEILNILSHELMPEVPDYKHMPEELE